MRFRLIRKCYHCPAPITCLSSFSLALNCSCCCSNFECQAQSKAIQLSLIPSASSSCGIFAKVLTSSPLSSSFSSIHFMKLLHLSQLNSLRILILVISLIPVGFGFGLELLMTFRRSSFIFPRQTISSLARESTLIIEVIYRYGRYISNDVDQSLNFYHKMLFVLGCLFLVYWVFFALLGYFKMKATFKKYSNRSIKQYPEAYKAFRRTDFQNWNQQKLIKGCFLRFPIKFLIMITGLLIILTTSMIKKFLGNKFGPTPQRIFRRLTMSFIHCLLETEGYDENITTPIVVSNHVCWLDSFYHGAAHWPISFVAKATVAKLPVIGQLATVMQSLYVERGETAARERTISGIAKRVEEYANMERNGKDIYPLVIFPEGTTSNGKSLMKFKHGAFTALSEITVICFKYSCPEFQMGMEEITTAEHALMTLCSHPKLDVLRFKVTPLFGENDIDYSLRVQKRISDATGFPIYEVGYREKIEYLKDMAKHQGVEFKDD